MPPIKLLAFALLGTLSFSSWSTTFSNRCRIRTGRYPAIYTCTSWWTQWFGTSGHDSAYNRLQALS